MRLTFIDHDIEKLELPWAHPLSCWSEGRVSNLDEVVPGETTRYVQHGEHTYAISELPAGAGRDAWNVLRELESHGLPVAHPTGLVEDRGEDGDLLISLWPEQALPLEEVIQAVDAEAAQQLQARIGYALVHLHLAGFNASESCSWRLAIAQSSNVFHVSALCLGGSLDVDLAATDREHDVLDATAHVRHCATLAGLGHGEAEAFGRAVMRHYQELWQQVEATRLFLEEGEFQLTARVTHLSDLSDRRRLIAEQGGIGLSVRCHVIDQKHHQRLLKMLTGLDVEESRGPQMLRDIFRYHSWLEFSSGRKWPRAQAAHRWLKEVFTPAISMLPQNLCEALMGQN